MSHVDVYIDKPEGGKKEFEKIAPLEGDCKEYVLRFVVRGPVSVDDRDAYAVYSTFKSKTETAVRGEVILAAFHQFQMDIMSVMPFLKPWIEAMMEIDIRDYIPDDMKPGPKDAA